MPKFLLFTILLLVLAGHLFAIKEDGTTNFETEYGNSSIEDLYFSDSFTEANEPLQIIESPSLISGETEKTQTVFINNGENCIYFENEEIPRLDFCPDKKDLGKEKGEAIPFEEKEITDIEDLTF